MSGAPGSAVLSCLAEVARVHETHGASTLRVVPVLYRSVDAERSNPAFTAAVPLVAEAARFLDGGLVDSSDPVLGSALEANPDAILQGALPVIVGALLPRGTELRIVHDGTSVDAMLVRAGAAVVASGGEATFLSVVRALFSNELRSGTFSVLAYSEVDLDSRMARACFQMLCSLQEQPGGLSRLRTLVVLVETAAESPMVHCPPGVGARYLLRSQRMVQRREPSDLRSEVSRLTHAKDRPLVLFLAAGFSISSKLPAGNTLRDAAIARILGEDPKADFDWPRELFRRQESRLTPSERSNINDFARRLTFEQVMRIEQDHSAEEIPQGILDFRTLHDGLIGRVPGAAVRQMQRMLSKPGKMIILTVNFDELLEHEHADRLEVIVNEDAFERFAGSALSSYLASSDDGRRVPYLKLHGTIGIPETCVASSRQTQQGLSPGKRAALDAILAATEGPLRWVYVGASMRDEDLRPFFDGGDFKQDVDERWVAPFPDPDVETFARGRELLPAWRETPLNQRLVTETADIFMTALADSWMR